MRKYFRLFTVVGLLFVGLGASSCFDVEEEYTFNADGSGSAKFTVDMAQMMSMMESFAGSMDSLGGEMESLDEMFTSTEIVDVLNTISGVRNVQNLSSKDEQVFGYSYEFASVEALNNAIISTQGDMNLLSALGMGGEDDGDLESAEDNIFLKKGKKLTRVFKVTPPEPDEEGGEEEQYKGLMTMFFADHYYTFRYHFANGVKKVKKNELAEISTDKKTVTIAVPLADLMEKEGDLGAQFKLK